MADVGVLHDDFAHLDVRPGESHITARPELFDLVNVLEFKETGGSTPYGHYLARTGDLFRIPDKVAHRTFSGDGRRRVTLEIVPGYAERLNGLAVLGVFQALLDALAAE
jgi:hypothetical protein